MSTLYFTQTGNGPVIVMLHGFLSSSHYFSHFKKLLATNHTVITFDLLGSGHSPQPTREVTYEMQVAAIEQTLKKIGVRHPFILLGHSMGALIAARYAAEHTKQVSSLLLFNAPLFVDREQAVATIEATGRHYRAALTHPRQRYLWRALKLLPQTYLPAMRPINFKDSLRTHHFAREGGYRNIIIEASLLDDLDRITAPTLLIVAKRDRFVYQQTLDDVSLSPNITTRLIDGGHHTLVKRPLLARDLVQKHIHQG